LFHYRPYWQLAQPLLSVWRSLPLLKYRFRGGEKNLIQERVAKMMVNGYKGFDIKETAELVLYDLRQRRGINLKAAIQHHLAITISGSRYEKLRTVNAPTLVIHGDTDWLIPIAHSQKLVTIMPNAKGLWLGGVAHLFPYPDMASVNRQILAHLDNNQRQGGIKYG
jgi:pimeloyl-ACP methyl ester carboxylesterase